MAAGALLLTGGILATVYLAAGRVPAGLIPMALTMSIAWTVVGVLLILDNAGVA